MVKHSTRTGSHVMLSTTRRIIYWMSKDYASVCDEEGGQLGAHEVAGPASQVPGSVAPMLRVIAAVALVAACTTACDGDETDVSPRARAYAVCRESVFTRDNMRGLTPDSRTRVSWPSLDSDDIRFERISDQIGSDDLPAREDRHLHVEARDVLYRGNDRTVHLYMDCDARRCRPWVDCGSLGCRRRRGDVASLSGVAHRHPAVRQCLENLRRPSAGSPQR